MVDATFTVTAAYNKPSYVTGEVVTITISGNGASIVIDDTKPIVDTSPTPRVWTVSTDKLSITTVA